MLQEFKAFALKGNVVDMAIGVIIGGAFGKIVTSLVNDIIMPPLGLLVGGMDFSRLHIPLKQATDTTEAVTIAYGLFINSIIDCLIIAFSIFMVMRDMNKLRRKNDTEHGGQKTKKPSKEVQLLTDIRDQLRSLNK